MAAKKAPRGLSDQENQRPETGNVLKNVFGQQKRVPLKTLAPATVGLQHATQIVVGEKEDPTACRETKGVGKSEDQEESGGQNTEDQNPVVKPKRCFAETSQTSIPNSTGASTTPLEISVAVITEEKNMGGGGMTPIQSGICSKKFELEFENITCLGSGAFGVVLKAKRKVEKAYFAIKIVPFNKNAFREVEVLLQLSHANIVRYHTCWMEDSKYQCDSTADSCSTTQSSDESSEPYLYIQMELCHTDTLRVWIDERNTQNVPESKTRKESLAIALQIALGVEYIHKKRFIHRDLKPANILFGPGRCVKIGDFGLVTLENDSDAENVQYRTADKGTPHYMAPEQKSQRIYDRKVDIFAMALIFFELLWKGTHHERSEVWGDVRGSILPQGFAYRFFQESIMIKSMLHKNSEKRPEASQLKTDLEKIICRLKATEIRRRGNLTT
ncbi:interferon-induced, double-stranded RNA-activated protein kinase-like [Aulostomus maculatus]